MDMVRHRARIQPLVNRWVLCGPAGRRRPGVTGAGSTNTRRMGGYPIPARQLVKLDSRRLIVMKAHAPVRTSRPGSGRRLPVIGQPQYDDGLRGCADPLSACAKPTSAISKVAIGCSGVIRAGDLPSPPRTRGAAAFQPGTVGPTYAHARTIARILSFPWCSVGAVMVPPGSRAEAGGCTQRIKDAASAGLRR